MLCNDGNNIIGEFLDYLSVNTKYYAVSHFSRSLRIFILGGELLDGLRFCRCVFHVVTFHYEHR